MVKVNFVKINFTVLRLYCIDFNWNLVSIDVVLITLSVYLPYDEALFCWLH